MKQLFLSHIHEEKELALLIKQAIEDEFSGFVDVFVSSDGISIPAGANFLKRIEDGLVESIGAMYLISPKSVNRNWINFELGAMWIRNAISIRSEENEIPTLPLCHSGMDLQQLPKPIDNLNAIIANQASQLEFAFRSIQNAVGGKGSLRTNFDELAGNIAKFERQYTLISNVNLALKLVNLDNSQFKEYCLAQRPGELISLELGCIPSDILKKVKALEAELIGHVSLQIDTVRGLAYNHKTGETGQNASITVNREVVLETLA
ncbi:toll/interleukin-1 receptor domain-containing protein [Vibrio crassostreae]|uniref:toll/interleukin-1 receptor domain-containing protein n=1 Tax=Vibrio crassostreae TaxID=246167 RepID=UPI00063132B9|nr:TIR domain-containing protein [Vibrio crassostreae]TCN99729.1 TIR domain-containing protein [Vibrio crassostreae]TCT50920.1 TIR domain-containing protein [Vibrio crassostreae]TCT73708.1 TIR domain-containing protein [Vibrio crassostreae]TCT75589.1 TIR domain-containing protein [Vibrio crassostreae]TCT94954.1 TIR domain-containing protein [Vibrio crassostreae]